MTKISCSLMSWLNRAAACAYRSGSYHWKNSLRCIISTSSASPPKWRALKKIWGICCCPVFCATTHLKEFPFSSKSMLIMSNGMSKMLRMLATSLHDSESAPKIMILLHVTRASKVASARANAAGLGSGVSSGVASARDHLRSGLGNKGLWAGAGPRSTGAPRWGAGTSMGRTWSAAGAAAVYNCTAGDLEPLSGRRANMQATMTAAAPAMAAKVGPQHLGPSFPRSEPLVGSCTPGRKQSTKKVSRSRRHSLRSPSEGGGLRDLNSWYCWRIIAYSLRSAVVSKASILALMAAILSGRLWARANMKSRYRARRGLTLGC
mmetsp:Transcript_144930/g.252767  ORF Transcript_144930/g.252767 Transcript_144930/m.252767 type:complete len:320 (-) Transcript_144930:1598-2557(-)